MTLLLAATAACRFVGDASLMLLFGSSMLAALAGPAAARAAEAVCLFRARRVAVLIVLFALVGLLALQAVSVGDGWASALDTGLLRILLWKTTFGQAWMWRMAAAVALVAAVFCHARVSVVAWWAGLALALTALTGHAAMHEGGLGVLHHFSQALHVLCAGAWVGGLLPLMGMLRQLSVPQERNAAAHALRVFSRLGHVAVAGVLVTGIANTLLIVGSWPLAWAMPYQLLLSIKIALVVCMVLLAVFNRYVWVPRLAAHPARAVRAIQRGTLAELTIAAGVLGLVAVFGLLEPV